METGCARCSHYGSSAVAVADVADGSDDVCVEEVHAQGVGSLFPTIKLHDSQVPESHPANTH